MAAFVLSEAEIYQRGYVTRDLDQAMALFKNEFGLGDFKVIPSLALEVKTPAGPERIVQAVAFAWAGDLMIELIEPLRRRGHFIRMGHAGRRYCRRSASCVGRLEGQSC